MKLEKLQIENFRCYEDQSIRFDEPLLLVAGRNDGGKTALLTAIDLFLRKRAKADEKDFRATDLDFESTCNKITLTATLNDSGEKRVVRRRFQITEEGIVDAYEEKGKELADASLRAIVDELGTLKAFERKTKDDQKAILTKFGVSDLTGTKGMLFERYKEARRDAKKQDAWKPFKNTGDLPDCRISTSEDAGDPIKQVLKSVKDSIGDEIDSLKSDSNSFLKVKKKLEEMGEKAVKEIERVFKRYDSSQITTTLDANLDIDLLGGLSIDSLTVSQGDNKRPISKMGAARRRKLLLAIQEWKLEDLRERNSDVNRFMLFDEPDTHFDFDAQRKLFSILEELAQIEGVNVLVATHSVNLIDRVPLKSILFLDQVANDGEVNRVKVDQLKDWGEIHSVARKLGLRNHVVLNSCLFCVEGQTEYAIMERLYMHYRPGKTFASIGVQLMTTEKTGKTYAWSMAKHALKNGKDVFLQLDEDCRTATARPINASRIKEFNDTLDDGPLIKEGKNLVYLGSKELEDTFSEDHVVAAIQVHAREECGKDLTDEDVRDFLVQAEKSDQSRSTYIEDNGGPGLKCGIGKPALGIRLVELIEDESTEFEVPEEVCEMFDRLEEYVERDRQAVA